MKKIYAFLIFGLAIGILTTACNIKTKPSLIQSKRKIEQFREQQDNRFKKNGIIDLSDGQRIKYDADFGPQSLNFDFKIDK